MRMVLRSWFQGKRGGGKWTHPKVDVGAVGKDPQDRLHKGPQHDERPEPLVDSPEVGTPAPRNAHVCHDQRAGEQSDPHSNALEKDVAVEPSEGHCVLRASRVCHSPNTMLTYTRTTTTTGKAIILHLSEDSVPA